MVGLLLWKGAEGRRKAVTLREEPVLQMRCLRAEILRGPRTPEAVLRRRFTAALKKMKKAGITRVILPAGWSCDALPQGMEIESTLPLRRALAADWVRKELEEKGLHPASARVAVMASHLSGEVVRTVTELTLRHRYVLLDVPHGGEELCRRLRREYGVAVQLGPDRGRLEEAEALVLFDPAENLPRNPVVLPLYDGNTPLPRLLLPPAWEDLLPQGADRTQLLAAMLRYGVIRPGAHLTF